MLWKIGDMTVGAPEEERAEDGRRGIKEDASEATTFVDSKARLSGGVY